MRYTGKSSHRGDDGLAEVAEGEVTGAAAPLGDALQRASQEVHLRLEGGFGDGALPVEHVSARKGTVSPVNRR